MGCSLKKDVRVMLFIIEMTSSLARQLKIKFA